jgi:ankyrin repeat protein
MFYNHAFKEAYEHGHTDIVNVLFKYIDKKDIFHFACQRDDLELAKKLVNDIVVDESELSSACQPDSKLETISFLLTKIDVTAYDAPIVAACSSNRPDIVKLLLDHGANPNAMSGFHDNDGDWMNVPLVCAAAHGYNIEIVRLLLDSPILEKKLLRGALYKACFKNRIDVVKLLLEAGADPTTDDEHAIRYSSPHIKKLLLEWKYRVDGHEYQKLKNEIV